MKMGNKKLFFVLIISMFFIYGVYALSESEITFPVSELGDCASEEECEVYCDDSENIEACLDFAVKYNLMPQEEIDEARKIMPLLLAGEMPGGCTEKEECDAYCEKDENFEECIDFALKAGYVSAEEAEMAKKSGGKGPGGCKRDECDTYCDKEENFEVCLEFAHDNGMISDEDYEMAKKTGGKGPGGCKGKEECDAYCDDHIRECMDWMIEHDLLSEEDKQRLDNMDDDMKCMLDCMLDANLKPGRDCGPGNMENPGCMTCANKCFSMEGGGEIPKICIDRSYSQEECKDHCMENPRDCPRGEGSDQDLDSEHRCMAECMVDKGLLPGEDCQEGDNNPDCSICGDRCFTTQERENQDEVTGLSSDERCMSKCMIDNGLTPGVDSSGPEFDSCVDKCFDKSQAPEPADQGGDSEGTPDTTTPTDTTDTGTTTTPTTNGGDNTGDTGGDTGTSPTTDTNNGEDAGGDDKAGVTGEVIKDSEGLGLLARFGRFIKNLFG